MLNSDELGEKGESRFRELCADAQLVCNKSDRDRTGWDFIVEFPFTLGQKLSLDSRPTPLSSHIQVKTSNFSTKSIKLRLSSAERIAKELKPTFIYVLKVDNNLSFKEAYLLHISDERLALILKRLRKAQKDETSQVRINEKYISITPSVSEKIDITGDALKSTIEKYVGSSLHAYVANKKRQLEELGFDGASYKAKVKIETNGVGELVDAFLGLKDNLKVIDFETWQTRFGITLPDGIKGEGTLSIQPSPFDSCHILIRSGSFSQPYVFEADIIVPGLPNLPKEQLKFLFKSDLFNIVLHHNKYELNFEFANHKLPVDNWLDFWSMMKIFAVGDGCIHIKAVKSGFEYTLPLGKSEGFCPEENCDFYLRFFNELLFVFKMAGVPRSQTITCRCIEDNYRDITTLKAILEGRIPRIKMEVNLQEPRDWQVGLSKSSIVSRLYQFDDVLIAVYGVSSFELKQDDGVYSVCSDDFALKQVQYFRDKSQFEYFNKHAIEVEKIDLVFSFMLGDQAP